MNYYFSISQNVNFRKLLSFEKRLRTEFMHRSVIVLGKVVEVIHKSVVCNEKIWTNRLEKRKFAQNQENLSGKPENLPKKVTSL